MKVIGLVAIAGMTAVTRRPIGRRRDDPDRRPLFVSACEETIAVAHASGIELPKDALAKVLDFIGHAPPAMKASMALDLERGNRLELPWLNGKVVELGRKLGVPTPTHAMLYAVLKPYAMGAPS